MSLPFLFVEENKIFFFKSHTQKKIVGIDSECFIHRPCLAPLLSSWENKTECLSLSDPRIYLVDTLVDFFKILSTLYFRLVPLKRYLVWAISDRVAAGKKTW